MTAVSVHAWWRQAIPPGLTQQVCLATVLALYSGLVACAWLCGYVVNAIGLTVGALVGLAWLAGLAAQGWMLGQGWVVVAAALMARRQRTQLAAQWQTLRLGQERTEESEHQAAADVARLTQSIEGLQQRLTRYRALQEVAQQLGRSMDVNAVAHILVTQAHAMSAKSSACLLFLVDRTSQSLALTASHRAAHVTSIPTKRGDVFDHTVLRTRRGLLIEDVQHDPRAEPAELEGRAIRSLVATPLLVDRRVEGILRLESEEPAAYTQEDLRLLDILAELGAAAVATARLYAQTQELAMTDSLTGLLVRRALTDGLRTELRRAERHQEHRAVLMVDIDHFKRYNDALGHAAGDLVLKGVARILKEQAGTDGLAARYGGEEFTVLLASPDAATALSRSEAIRAAVAGESFVLRREATHVTVSIGVAHYPADGHEPIELLRVADERLYRAKQSGRNRVCAA